jgi:response regulator RpfG family c-di-GMP phosphodiesterase
MAMNRNILVVDDDRNLLHSLVRGLRKNFLIEAALGPQEGLKILSEKGPFAVIVSDLRMPVMDGIQFLSKAKTMTPDSVRIILTGNADLQNAIEAVNKGNIYRFLTKPCPSHLLSAVLEQAIEQYRLLTAEKELLEKTLKGSVKVLSELLSLVNPEAFGKSSRIKLYASDVAKHLDISHIWLVETAAMLSQIGCVTLSEDITKKIYQGCELTEEEADRFKAHPKIGSQLLSQIPRMEEIAEIIACQDRHFDGKGQIQDPRKGESIPLGARILKVVLDFDALESKGLSKSDALKELERHEGWYDPQVLKALQAIWGVKKKYVINEMSVDNLRAQMILAEDVKTLNEQLLISRGQEVTWALKERLNNFAFTAGVKEPIRVFVPLIADDRQPA